MPADAQPARRPTRDHRAPGEDHDRGRRTSRRPRRLAADCALRGTVSEVVYLGTFEQLQRDDLAGAEIIVFQPERARQYDVTAAARRARLAAVGLAPLLRDRNLTHDHARSRRTRRSSSVTRPWSRRRAFRWPACGRRLPCRLRRPGQEGRGAEQDAADKYWARTSKNGTLTLRQLAAVHRHGRTRPLKDFTATTGIKVDLPEVIQDDRAFFGKVQPQLAAGQSHRLRHHGPHQRRSSSPSSSSWATWSRSTTPCCRTSPRTRAPRIKNRSFDPGNVYSVPWAVGLTGIAYNPKYIKTPRSPASGPVEPRVQGQGRHDVRHPGDRELRHVRAGHRPGDVRRRPTGRRPAEKLKQQRDAGHRPQVLRARLRRRAGQGRRVDHAWPGRATSSSRSCSRART